MSANKTMTIGGETFEEIVSQEGFRFLRTRDEEIAVTQSGSGADIATSVTAWDIERAQRAFPKMTFTEKYDGRWEGTTRK